MTRSSPTNPSPRSGSRRQRPTTREELVHRLGAAILNDEGLMEEPWTRLALIVKFFEASSRLEAVAELENGDDAPVTTEHDGAGGVIDVLGQLRAVMAREEKAKPFVACRVRVAKGTGALELDFEHQNRDRWEYDPRDEAGKRAALGFDD